MGAASLLSAEDKAKVKKAIPTSSSTNKIVTAAVGRVYYAKPEATTWTYAGATGALVLCADKAKNGLWFRVVDLSSGRGVIWEHELPNEIEYNQEKPFFHTWAGDDAAIAFVFASEHEASDFYKKVANRGKYANKFNKAAALAAENASGGGAAAAGGGVEKRQSFAKRIKGRLDKTLISAPKTETFEHRAHMGYDAEKGFSSSGVDPSWQVLLEQLSMQGVSEADIKQNEAFIKDYINQQGGIDQALAMSERQQEDDVPPPVAPRVKKAPPPPTTRRKPAPAPPPSLSSRTPAPPARQAPTPPPTAPSPPPPLPPARSPAAPSAPPPPPPPPSAPPTRSSAPPPPPPPPPSAPPRSGGAPPPPPPPPARQGGPPPPPPPPPGAPATAPPAPPLPQGDGNRSALLASIQGQGVHKLRKVDDSEKRVSPMAAGGAAVAAGAAGGAAVAATADSGGGGDLASSLAAALAQRKQDLGDSDEEEESDDEWD